MKPLFLLASSALAAETGALLVMRAPYTLAAFTGLLGLVLMFIATKVRA